MDTMVESAPEVAALLRAFLDDDGSVAEAGIRNLQAEMARFRLEYSCGMEEVLTKINNLRREFDEIHRYKPIEHVKTRMKSNESLLAKARKLGCEPDFGSIRQSVRDIAGIRVVCTFVDDLYRVSDMLLRQPDVTLLQKKDYVAQPKPSGYQSLHLIVGVPVFLSDRSVQVPVEVQLRTIAMDFWASIEHQINYKYDGQVPVHLRENLHAVAESAAQLDRRMGVLRGEVRSLEGS